MITDKDLEEGIAAYLKHVKGSAGPMDLYREAARLGWNRACEKAAEICKEAEPESGLSHAMHDLKVRGPWA